MCHEKEKKKRFFHDRIIIEVHIIPKLLVANMLHFIRRTHGPYNNTTTTQHCATTHNRYKSPTDHTPPRQIVTRERKHPEGYFAHMDCKF